MNQVCGDALFNHGNALFGVNIYTMAFWNLYIAAGKLIVPTSAKAEAGFGIEVEPVFVASLSDSAGSSDAIAQAFKQGNPSVPTLQTLRRDYPQWFCATRE
jgi:hypothetical protein